MKATTRFSESFPRLGLAMVVQMGIASGLLANAATIYPEAQKQLIDTVFFDLKSPSAAYRVSINDSLYNATTLFEEDGFNGVRTSIYGTRDHPTKPSPGRPAHPEPGVIDGQYYANEVGALLNALAVNPDLVVFASKKLNGKASFPVWVLQTDSDNDGIADRNVHPPSYAIMLVDYIEYMADLGIPTHILGVDNEFRYNEGYITPDRYRRTIDAFKAELASRNTQRTGQGKAVLPLPKFIGPEDYHPNANNWMDNLITKGWGDRLDIYGNHYYPDVRNQKIDLLKEDLDWAGDRPKWHTELHWSTKSEFDDFDEAEDGIGSLWDCMDLGMTGFMWWDYHRDDGRFRGATMREITTHLLGYRPVMMTDHDGVDILTDGMLQTRALRKGNTLRVYVINMSPSNYSEYAISLNTGSLGGDVTYNQWQDTDPAVNNNPLEGTSYVKRTGIAPQTDGRTFTIDIPPRSYTFFTVPSEPPHVVNDPGLGQFSAPLKMPCLTARDDQTTIHFEGTLDASQGTGSSLLGASSFGGQPGDGYWVRINSQVSGLDPVEAILTKDGNWHALGGGNSIEAAEPAKVAVTATFERVSSNETRIDLTAFRNDRYWVQTSGIVPTSLPLDTVLSQTFLNDDSTGVAKPELLIVSAVDPILVPSLSIEQSEGMTRVGQVRHINSTNRGVTYTFLKTGIPSLPMDQWQELQEADFSINPVAGMDGFESLDLFLDPIAGNAFVRSRLALEE